VTGPERMTAAEYRKLVGADPAPKRKRAIKPKEPGYADTAVSTPDLLVLPWPPAALHAHATAQAWSRIKATKAYRRTAHILAMKFGVRPNPQAVMRVEYLPPARWAYDCHSFPQRLKPAIDGIADAMRCDDNGFRVHWPVAFGPVVKGGAIIIMIGENPP
jgi:crossover junction endodeoxyribonuclease RusA